MFLKNVLILIAQSGITKNKLATELCLGKNSFVDWRNGSSPSIDTVLKIANYFNVSVDYLLKGETSSVSTDDPSKAELIENFNGMNEAGQDELLKHSRLLLNSDQYKKCGLSVEHRTA